MLNIEDGATGATVMDLDALNKALEMGYGTDSATLTGGGAFRIQSLDTAMQSVIQENKHFTLFNDLPKPKIGATVDEWTEQSGIGGFLGGSTNTEAGVINEATGDYNRRVGMVKYLQTRRQISVVAAMTNNIEDPETVEQRNGALQLCGDANYLAYRGNSAVVPTEFDGISVQIKAAVAAGLIDGDHVIDLKGSPLVSIEPFTRAGAMISAYGNFGTPTDIYWPNSVQADMDANLDPAFRVSLTDNFDSVKLGAPVRGLRLSQGDVRTKRDVFIPDDRMSMPFAAQTKLVAIATGNAAMQPTLAAGTPGADAATAFLTGHAGNYFYYVAGVSKNGESTGVKSGQIAIAAGQSVALTITASAGNTETGYAIYRSRKNGTNANTDFRLMARVAKAGGTTVFTDRNALIPGTTEAYMLNMTPGATAITWRQMLPMFKFPLFPTNAAVKPWAQLLAGYLRISKLAHHAVFTNIVPNSAQWRPFG